MPSQTNEVTRRERASVLRALRWGPKSTRELGIRVETARALAAEGTIACDPDRFPDEYVPGNPLVCRLPGDEKRWPGWEAWNV